MADPTATKYAPAERADKHTVESSFKLISEHVCSDLLSLFPLPLLILNTQRQIVLCNKAFEELLGSHKLEDFLGARPGEVLKCVYADNEYNGCGTCEHCRKCNMLKAILESMNTKETAHYDCQLLQSVDGAIKAKDLRVFVSPFPLDNASYYLLTAHDIGDEKRRRILEKIFFHDLLNTAGGARGLVDLAYEEGPQEIRDLLGTIRVALFGLVDEIMKQKQLVDVENGDYQSTPITLQGLELLMNVADEYRKNPNFQGKIIDVDLDSENLAILADYTLLKRVLGNMTKNALEATPNGQTVRIGLKPHGDMARFWVHNKRAMPVEVQLQVFKRSFSTKGKGRGLGTYSIKLLTENYLGGTVDFQSSEEEGTTFWVDLPQKK